MSDRQQAAEWYLLIQDAAGVFRVVSRNGQPLDWRPLSNVFRGARLRAATRLAGESIYTGVAAVGAGFAAPVIAPGCDGIRAVLLSFQDPDPTDVPLIALWHWSFTRERRPPLLRMSAGAAQLWGLEDDRPVRGPVDFYRSIVSLGDVLSHLSFLYESPADSRRRSPLTLVNSVGQTGVVQSFEVVRRSSDGSRAITGVAWRSRDSETATVASGAADAAACRLLTVGGPLAVVTDMRSDCHPYIVKWISTRPAQMAHGLSEGVATSSLHPADIERLQAYCTNEASRQNPSVATVLQNLRVGRGDGAGWLSCSAVGYQVARSSHPSIWLWALRPDAEN